jgi:cellulose synthase/poly-beta-1,6-N-acetylglucosamine synthase-like glycosyltransferase
MSKVSIIIPCYNQSEFIAETIDSVNRGTVLQEEREKLLKEGNVSDSKDTETDYIINYLTPRIKYGRFDLVKSEIDDHRTLASTNEGFLQLHPILYVFYFVIIKYSDSMNIRKPYYLTLTTISFVGNLISNIVVGSPNKV